jgi:hypothetical protein
MDYSALPRYEWAHERHEQDQPLDLDTILLAIGLRLLPFVVALLPLISLPAALDLIRLFCPSWP